MKNPLVSIVLIVRNGERFLDLAIQSVMAQTYRPTELIVVDGNSTDRTAEIIQSYPEIRYLLQVNLGIARAYNQGIDAARGDLIAFMSHDDLWSPEKLALQTYALFDRKADYVVCKVQYFLEPGLPPPPGFRRELFEKDVPAFLAETLLAHKSLFSRIGKFDPRLSTAEDVDFFARANDFGARGYVVQKVLVDKRVHDSNISLLSKENDRNLLALLRESIHRKQDK
jgi:glycosyltransferase involved in cell wall biosynthesis